MWPTFGPPKLRLVHLLNRGLDWKNSCEREKKKSWKWSDKYLHPWAFPKQNVNNQLFVYSLGFKSAVENLWPRAMKLPDARITVLLKEADLSADYFGAWDWKKTKLFTLLNNRESTKNNCLGLWLVLSEMPHFLVSEMLCFKTLLLWSFEKTILTILYLADFNFKILQRWNFAEIFR